MVLYSHNTYAQLHHCAYLTGQLSYLLLQLHVCLFGATGPSMIILNLTL